MTRGNRTLVFASAGLIALLLIFAMAKLAGAHTPSASLTCEGGARADLQNYNHQNGHVNHVKATLDGVVIHEGDFGDDFQLVKDPLDPYVGHTFKLEVTAWDDPTGSKGWTKTYDLEIGPCQEKPSDPPSSPPSAPPSASPSPTPPATPPPSDPPVRTPRPTGPPTDTE